MAKVGRPKSDNPKDIHLKTRLDNITSKKFKEYCDKRGITKSDAIRAFINACITNDKNIDGLFVKK